MELKVGVLTISDKASKGLRKDEGGPLLIKIVKENLNTSHIVYKIVPDEKEQIKTTILEWIQTGLDLILTTGGTGPSPRDVTPETTLEIIEKRYYGLEILMLLEGLKSTPTAAFSRAVVGSKGSSLIINLPGNPKAIEENFMPLIQLIPHLLLEIKGLKGDHESH
ncbi:MAG: MogA/MoaB family molybdenum cofactor biosynthesis protein [candidate division WOR-3 bacterium]